MYNWSYFVNTVCAKMNIDEEELTNLSLINALPSYANEAMTQICSSVRPDVRYKEIYVTNDMLETFVSIDVPEFVSFSDAPATCKRSSPFFVDGGCTDNRYHEVGDESFEYIGYDKLLFHIPGNYRIPYNARWFFFSSDIESEDEITAPADVCDAVIAYMVSQCYKIDDEKKSAIFRNEYEMALSRIDNVDFKSQRTMHIGGGW